MKEIKDTKEIIPAFEAKTDPFGGNVSGEHAYKRTERIVSAIYLVTNHVPYSDPLRERVRSIGHELLSEVMAVRGGFRASNNDRLGVLLARVRETISLVRLLQIAGYVSSQNVQVLTHALDELGQFFVSAQHSTLSDGIQLNRDDFIPAERLAIPIPSAQRQIQSTSTANSVPSSVQIHPRRSAASRPPRSPGRSVQTEVHGERRKLITDILARGGALGIKDIAAQMVGCSEKTVQRELSVLVRERKVKKEGEKRWSSYTLIEA